MSNAHTSEHDGRVRACLNVGRTMKSSNTEADTQTRQLVEDYAVWFANC